MDQRDIDALGRSIRQAADANGTGPMTDTQAGLLPCPFCGGEAERIDFPHDPLDVNAGGSCISCKKCGASSAVHFDRKENLYSDWNDRPSTPASAEVVERAKQLLVEANNGAAILQGETSGQIFVQKEIAIQAIAKALQAGAAVQVPGWSAVVGDWKDETVAIHGPNGYITCGLRPDQARALIAAHNGDAPTAPAAPQKQGA